jgi:tetratricopeptide (TPR) repeat protein
VTKSVVDRRMMVLGLLGLVLGSPALAASPPPKPLAQPVDATLCDSPVSNLPRTSASDSFSKPPGSFRIRGASATAAELFTRSQYEFEPVDQIEALNRAIALAPNYQKAYSERAWLYKSEQQFDRALADYDRAFQLQPDDFNFLASQGLLHGELQQWDKLIAVYDRLYGIRPDWAAHYHTIQARAYAELQQWPQVIEQYTIAIKLNQLKANLPIYEWEALHQTPRFVTQLGGKMTLWNDPSGQALLYLNRGYAYERQTQTRLATADYTLALAKVKGLPSSVEELYRSRCRLKVGAGDRAGAKSDVKLANATLQAWQRSKLPPSPLPSSILQPPVGLPQLSPPPMPPVASPPMPPSGLPSPTTVGSPVGDWELSMRELGIPIEYFNSGMPMDRDFAPAYYHRGIWRLQPEQFDVRLIADFDRAIALNPQFSLAHAARGEALRQLKRSDEAMTALDNALKLDPTLAAARLSQGMIWLERGDAKQAELAFDDVLTIDPESIAALTERAKIRRSRRDILGSTADDRRVKQVRDRWQLPLPKL